ncbi:hypothetical protein GCM10011361_04880 [Muriicola marianensis]|uniref:Uncharacterized protein n=2 Tax=Muriicola marianensis TaxID=1324801 RepID=A0ABQ1QRA4_9FLAO|nr:hypothetical protein GCM10011361_04880 [Muriicola marianensis]
MSRDPLAVIDTDLLPHIGMLSNIGAILWSVGAGISFFSYVVFYDINEVTNRHFLLYSCLFTLLVLTDDLFMLHDIILPQFFQIKEDYLYLLYLALMGIYLFRFRSLHLKSKYILLILAITCFAFSIFVDQQFQGRWHPARHFVEDGFKFMGIAFWTSYLFNISRTYALRQKEI